MRHVLQAWREFTLRYAEAFGAAWSMRNVLDPPKRSADELAFLPAHLELIETPVSPTLRWTMRLIVGLFLVALAWSIFGEPSSAAAPRSCNRWRPPWSGASWCETGRP
jgi:hemolysin D